MDLFLNKLLGSVIEIAVFLIIPVLWWLITTKRKENFFYWIGLRKTNNNRNIVVLIIIGIIAFCGVGFFLLYMVKGMEIAASEFSGLSYGGLPAAVIYAFLGTGLPEELIFRGFLLKRLSNKFGFIAGNSVQGLLFGLLHGVLMFSVFGIIKTALVVIFVTVIALYIGFINERRANGSIIPGWIIHGASNTFSSIMSLFSII